MPGGTRGRHIPGLPYGVADQQADGGFGPRHAWLYVTILAVGYMISRGLAKAGSREPYWSDGSNSDRS